MAAHQPLTEEASCAGVSAFQRDILAIIAREGAPYGLAIKRALEQHRYTEINHGRLYPNIDRLVRNGLVEKGTIDQRTNSYELTTKGRDELTGYESWLATCLERDGDE